MFSRRTHFEAVETSMESTMDRLRADGVDVIDLSNANPLALGLGPDVAATLDALNDTRAMNYAPLPRGLREAREAVSAYYRGVVDPEKILLTSGTSEAYSYLFRLLCDAGDEVMVPQPGYPLFDMLAAMDGITLTPYALLYDHGWQVDVPSMESAVTPRTRAILIVHPNNPTGHMTSIADRAALYAFAKRHGLAVIVDEVFLDYPVEAEAQRQSFVSAEAEVLTFVLSGLSKVCALPQMKVAWTAVCGPSEDVDEALLRLDLIADTFLSVGSPPQVALTRWLAERVDVQARILERVRLNLHQLDRAIAGSEISRLRLEAGWAAVLRIPATLPDTELVLQLLEEGIAVHPGSFYGFAGSGWIVLSLLAEPAEFLRGITRLLRGIKAVNSPSSTAAGISSNS